MEALYEKYRWVVWNKFRGQIIALYAEFDLEDWDFVRAAIDAWVDDHMGDWCDYAIKNYNAPPAAREAVSSGRSEFRRDLT